MQAFFMGECRINTVHVFERAAGRGSASHHSNSLAVAFDSLQPDSRFLAQDGSRKTKDYSALAPKKYTCIAG